MKTVGIIAEYNPFHNGHLYQMREARRRSGADYVIAAMSPDFVQRGEPALLDKWVRARMALEAGADLVLELPVRCAAGSAEYFAEGGVGLLSSLGVVDALSFGYENAPLLSDHLSESRSAAVLDALTDAADFFSRKESDPFRSELKKLLAAGMTYAQARCEAYASVSGRAAGAQLLRSPNNILAVEYLKAIRRHGNAMSVVPVPRAGAGYHDTGLPSSPPGRGACESAPSEALRIPGCVGSASAVESSTSVPAASATGIRLALAQDQDVSDYMPEDAHGLLTDELAAGRFLVPSDLDLLLHAALLREQDHLEQYQDVSADLANRIRALLGDYTGFESFAAQVKTRQLTLTRVKRALIHILLGIRDRPLPAPYVRVLGFRRTAQPLLHEIGRVSRVPMITKLPHDLPEGLAEDVAAAHLWEMLVCHKTGRPLVSEYRRQLAIL